MVAVGRSSNCFVHVYVYSYRLLPGKDIVANGTVRDNTYPFGQVFGCKRDFGLCAASVDFLKTVSNIVSFAHLYLHFVHYSETSAHLQFKPTNGYFR